MLAFDMEFDFYSDEPPQYFGHPANEFDGYDPNGHNDSEEMEE